MNVRKTDDGVWLVSSHTVNRSTAVYYYESRDFWRCEGCQEAYATGCHHIDAVRASEDLERHDQIASADEKLEAAFARNRLLEEPGSCDSLTVTTANDEDVGGYVLRIDGAARSEGESICPECGESRPDS
jgi:hypothetical protein